FSIKIYHLRLQLRRKLMNGNYEDLFKRYDEISLLLDNKEISLEESIKLYEESTEIFTKLEKMLSESKQKIINRREKNV
ncbi:exodeoxyribonuclease VII small subunit, partial [Helcococcus ovis]|uniref:exodeoxyribonuclease VII small subunit n=1 Tax=Helcococcus ovis TaxID=72026 RepID=UPI0038B80776